MAITLMYITNRIDVAKIAQEAGVDRIWIDLEVKGKEERQKGMNTVKSQHTIEDIKKIKPVLSTSQLMVRVNPMDEESEDEINQAIEAGAEYIMLPMFKTREEVEQFLMIVNGRAKTILLVETAEAAENIETYIDLSGIDEVHIGLNDLHLSYKKDFMFELMADGTVDKLSEVLNAHDVRFGVGGLARIGYGMLPAEVILTQHYKIGSQMAILSRSFCDANTVENPQDVKQEFLEGVQNIRAYEKKIERYTDSEYESNYLILKEKVQQIAENIRRRKQ